MKRYGFGVDIGGTTCKIGLFDMSGVIVEKWEIPTNTENNGAAILDDVAAAEKWKKSRSQKTMYRESDSAFRDRWERMEPFTNV